VEEEDILYGNTAFPYSQAFFQLYHLATVAGIARAASQQISKLVGRRKRSFTHGNGDLPSDDPQILEIVGRVCSAAYVAGAVVASAARTLQSAADCDEGERETLVVRAELEVWQAQDRIFPMLLEAAGLMFDALSGSATLRTNGLDRHWRNIRTIASHNPRVYRTRIVGDFAVNGTRPPGQWRVGVADAS
jgi:alkylation response protein AidB-like acyl-CoA dehydrogenase